MSDESTELNSDADAPSVVIVLQDNLRTGELEIGGVQKPIEFNPRSAAHVVGKFLAENMDQILAAAASQAAVNRPDAGESIIGPDRERTIVVESGRRDLLAGGDE